MNVDVGILSAYHDVPSTSVYGTHENYEEQEQGLEAVHRGKEQITTS